MNRKNSSTLINRLWIRTKEGRILSQLVILALTVWIAIQMISGVRGATVERYCPFGGIETLIPWLNKTGTLCSLSTLNIAMFAGVVVLTVLFKRAFCSHICPMGAILEWTGLLGRKFVIKERRIPRRLDRALTWLKYPLLLLILVLTVKVGELVFRDYDPYYILFTAGRGHGVGIVGIGVTAAIIGAGLFIPLSFCRYLCPMGACLAPVGRFGLLRVSRCEEECTSCGLCDEACEWGITVSESKTVVSEECSNCLDCMRACPVDDALTLNVGRAQS